MYQGKLCSARPRRAAGPRPDLADQPTATKPRPKWKRPARRPARHAVLKSAMTKINYKKWETATSWDCHPASADPFRRGPPRSSVTAAKAIPIDRFDAERLAAQVDRSSAADFNWCWPSRRPCWLCCSQFASSDRCQLDPCRSQRSNNGVADRCELGRLYQGAQDRIWPNAPACGRSRYRDRGRLPEGRRLPEPRGGWSSAPERRTAAATVRLRPPGSRLRLPPAVVGEAVRSRRGDTRPGPADTAEAPRTAAASGWPMCDRGMHDNDLLAHRRRNEASDHHHLAVHGQPG
jgi:hypothetical protein